MKAESISGNSNKELSELFGMMANCYRYLGPMERFRANAYESASKMLGNMKESVENYDHKISNLDKLKGIGESIAEKIIEFIDTGKIKAYEDLKSKVPIELFDLMKVEGVGPATIRMIHDKLDVDTKSELISKLRNHKLFSLKGIGAKKLKLLQKGLNIYKEKKEFLYKWHL